MPPAPHTDPLPALAAPRDRRGTGLAWWTVALLALLLAAGDGFWATSVRGAVGYIQNVQDPFHDWLLYLAVMGPIFAATIAATLWLTHRLAANHRLLQLTIAATAIIAATTVLALAQIALTAIYDYHSQQTQVALIHHIHAGNANGPSYRLDPGVAPQPACTGLCDEQRQTIAVHYRAIRLASLLLLLTNTVLILWTLALRGGRIWIRRGPDGVTADATEPLAVV